MRGYPNQTLVVVFPDFIYVLIARNQTQSILFPDLFWSGSKQPFLKPRETIHFCLETLHIQSGTSAFFRQKLISRSQKIYIAVCTRHAFVNHG